jgi:hypothetical protein
MYLRCCAAMRLVAAIGNENFFKHSGNGTRRYKEGIKSTGLKAGVAFSEAPWLQSQPMMNNGWPNSTG